MCGSMAEIRYATDNKTSVVQQNEAKTTSRRLDVDRRDLSFPSVASSFMDRSASIRMPRLQTVRHRITLTCTCCKLAWHKLPTAVSETWVTQSRRFAGDSCDLSPQQREFLAIRKKSTVHTWLDFGCALLWVLHGPRDIANDCLLVKTCPPHTVDDASNV